MPGFRGHVADALSSLRAQITRHVAEIVCRQEFILKLARAMMMFGGPSHRLQAQIKATAKVLDIELSCLYLPDVMLISFDDAATGTSSIKFIRQGSALDIGKLQEAHELYWRVSVPILCARSWKGANRPLHRYRRLFMTRSQSRTRQSS